MADDYFNGYEYPGAEIMPDQAQAERDQQARELGLPTGLSEPDYITKFNELMSSPEWAAKQAERQRLIDEESAAKRGVYEEERSDRGRAFRLRAATLVIGGVIGAAVSGAAAAGEAAADIGAGAAAGGAGGGAAGSAAATAAGAGTAGVLAPITVGASMLPGGIAPIAAAATAPFAGAAIPAMAAMPALPAALGSVGQIATANTGAAPAAAAPVATAPAAAPAAAAPAAVAPTLFSRVGTFLTNNRDIIGAVLGGAAEGVLASSGQSDLLRESYALRAANYGGTNPGRTYRPMAQNTQTKPASERFPSTQAGGFGLKYDPQKGRMVRELMPRRSP